MQVDGFEGANGSEGANGFEQVDDVLDETNNLQSQFYQQGYTSGHAHGQLHGLFEGRALGREKAFELWEEVGYYEGWARFWAETGAGAQLRGKGGRALNHARLLLDLIATFPTTNPTPAPTHPPSGLSPNGSDPPTTGPPAAPTGTVGIDGTGHNAVVATGPDLPTLLSTIRARYRLLCSSLGVRPRLVSASAVGAGSAEVPEGPMKGVDTSQLRF